MGDVGDTAAEMEPWKEDTFLFGVVPFGAGESRFVAFGVVESV